MDFFGFLFFHKIVDIVLGVNIFEIRSLFLFKFFFLIEMNYTTPNKNNKKIKLLIISKNIFSFINLFIISYKNDILTFKINITLWKNHGANSLTAATNVVKAECMNNKLRTSNIGATNFFENFHFLNTQKQIYLIYFNFNLNKTKKVSGHFRKNFFSQIKIGHSTQVKTIANNLALFRLFIN
ncbi:hypothetical protein BpHYR1_007300 [Brachionus plicatilis]|uniref:Uncharacterized protein n=1 Tax=Brachionus plicatilis TaxID=10195 RepID=A0A3M7Q1J1_BRAPC|nr:hypothetical protein BpHYR1_007300 [Brachionus plicatilis]